MQNKMRANFRLRVLGNFELFRRISKNVYEAKDLARGSLVAVKLVPFFDKDDDGSFFLNESGKHEAGIYETLCGGDWHNQVSPNSHVAPFLYASGGQDEYHALVLGLLGPSLSSKLKSDGAFSLWDALEIVEKLSFHLEKINSKGILHRDIKPGNACFGRDDKSHVLFFIVSSFFPLSHWSPFAK